MPAIRERSSAERRNPCVVVNRSLIARERGRRPAPRQLSISQYASSRSSTDVCASSPAGRGRAKSRDRKSARSSDSSKRALYIRCSSRLPRRMSTMNAMLGCKSDDVGEVLVGRHAEIAVAATHRLEGGHHVLEGPFVSDEVLGLEEPVRLRELLDERPELPVGQRRRQRRGRRGDASGCGAAHTSSAITTVHANAGLTRIATHRTRHLRDRDSTSQYVRTCPVVHGGEQILDRIQQRHGARVAGRRARVETRSHQRARGVNRQRRHVGHEVVPQPVPEQITLYVGRVEDAHGFAVRPEVTADLSKGSRAAKVADDRHDQVGALAGRAARVYCASVAR